MDRKTMSLIVAALMAGIFAGSLLQCGTRPSLQLEGLRLKLHCVERSRGESDCTGTVSIPLHQNGRESNGEHQTDP